MHAHAHMHAHTLPQVKIFGGFTRWSSDVAPPSASVPGRVILTTIDAAVRAATAAPTPGPVHLNMQFREPLAPNRTAWDAAALLQGTAAWRRSAEPYTTPVAVLRSPGTQPPPAAAAAADAAGAGPQPPGALPALPLARGVGGGAGGAGWGAVMQLLLSARSGLLVVGEQLDSSAAAAALQLGGLLGFPVAADVLSGLRVGSSSSSSSSSGGGDGNGSGSSQLLLQHMDHILLPPPAGGGGGGGSSWWRRLQPDVIVQLGPRVTSKRINQFMVRGVSRRRGWVMVVRRGVLSPRCVCSGNQPGHVTAGPC
jgi:isochorismate synthase/2-succinyl-5-enolpyruvyl-6-hydroxy-3-cyclohexene-1-carboxylate synthase/2-succinyl-6-hydroxy-2,4-cyclohexadiene-1-carboxylate synthase/O-succinylbenzoate synthase